MVLPLGECPIGSLPTFSNIALWAFGRRLRGRNGPRIAIKVMARKLALLYWRVMEKGLEYAEKGIQNYEKLQQLFHSYHLYLLNFENPKF